MTSYAFNNLDGCVVQRRSRTTGHLVGLYNAAQASLDESSGAWATICEEHGHVVNHATLAHARSHLGDPSGWCEECMAEQEALVAHVRRESPAGLLEALLSNKEKRIAKALVAQGVLRRGVADLRQKPSAFFMV